MAGQEDSRRRSAVEIIGSRPHRWVELETETASPSSAEPERASMSGELFHSASSSPNTSRSAPDLIETETNSSEDCVARVVRSFASLSNGGEIPKWVQSLVRHMCESRKTKEDEKPEKCTSELRTIRENISNESVQSQVDEDVSASTNRLDPKACGCGINQLGRNEVSTSIWHNHKFQESVTRRKPKVEQSRIPLKTDPVRSHSDICS